MAPGPGGPARRKPRNSSGKRLRGLCRLLPLPWANTTIPAACSGTVRYPARRTTPTLACTSSPAAGGVSSRRRAGLRWGGGAFQAGDDLLIVRAELPGMDPDNDFEITVENGTLTIHAERREEHKQAHRSEFRYGSFTRSIPCSGRVSLAQESSTGRPSALRAVWPCRGSFPCAEVEVREDNQTS